MKKVLILTIIILIIAMGFSYDKKWTMVWSYKIGKPMPQLSLKSFGSPALLPLNTELLLVPSWDGNLYCFSKKSVVWKRNLRAPVFKDPVKYKNYIFVATYDGVLRAISGLNGNTIWKISFKNPITSNILILSNNLYVAVQKNLYLISFNGEIIRKVTLPTVITMVSRLDEFFLFDNYGRIYRLDDNLNLISFFDTGFDEQNPPFYFEGYDVFTTMQGVILFYKDNIEYNRVSLPNGIISKPILSDDKKSFYILTSFGKLFQVNSKEIVNYYDSQFYSVQALAKYNKKIYFCSVYNQMYVLDKDLKYIKQFKLKSLPTKNIIFDSKGGFYYLGQDGVLYYYLKVIR